MAQNKPSKDHLGNEYESFSAMCRAYGHQRNVVFERLKLGVSLEEALTKPNRNKVTVTDHKGNVYQSFHSMCKAYGKDSKTVKRRIEKGATLEEALTNERMYPVESKAKKQSTDHLGNVYSSFKEMCETYGIDAHLVQSRLKFGMSLEKALTQPIRKYQKKDKKDK